MGKKQVNPKDELLRQVQSAINFDQPGLTAELTEDGVLVMGEYALKPTFGDSAYKQKLTDFSVEILFPFSFPEGEPEVKEVAGRIERNLDHHITSEEGDCCICVWSTWIAGKTDITPQRYMDEPFYNFFFGQFYAELNDGEWPFGEEAHNEDGIIGAFAEKLGCNPDPVEIWSFLFCCTELFGKVKHKKALPCPCRSGKGIMDCCIERVRKLRKQIPEKDAQRMFVQACCFEIR